jgi:hypothetical protein
VTAVDLAAGRVLRRITGSNVAQGVADVAFPDSVYAANASDGSVRILDGDDCTDRTHRSWR